MKKLYDPPEMEMIVIRITDDVMLTDSVEVGGDILDTEFDDIEEP